MKFTYTRHAEVALAARCLHKQDLETRIMAQVHEVSSGEYEVGDTFLSCMGEKPGDEESNDPDQFLWILQGIDDGVLVTTGRFEAVDMDFPKGHMFHGKTLMMPVADED